MTEQTPQNSLSLDTATKLAFDRTRVAYERTMMSWIRTATSLITFGFSIYKFFQIEAPTRGQESRLIGQRGFAFTLVSIGLLSLIFATIEHRQNIRWRASLKPPARSFIPFCRNVRGLRWSFLRGGSP